MMQNGEVAASKLEVRLDLLEKVVLCTLFSLFAFRLVNSYMISGAWINLIYIPNEAALILFILFRRSAKVISTKPYDWFVGFAGTCLPLLLIPNDEAVSSALTGLVLLLILSGMIFQIVAKFTLRRSFGVVAANRGVKRGGPYRMVRHPMYAGYIVTQIGFLIANPSLYNAGILLLAWTLQIARIHAEERVLAEDPAYQAMMAQTKYRLLPGVY
jgi:protein-S-isoprenylcysteine O-methyltransferase Ste14